LDCLHADYGISLNRLTQQQKEDIKKQLTLEAQAWKDNPGFTVCSYHEDDKYLWVPRAFGKQLNQPYTDTTVTGIPQKFNFIATLDESRGQTAAVKSMEQYLQQQFGGVLIAGTGFGKTLVSYAIASKFNTSIGVFIYAGHMFDNWIKEAEKALGIKQEDIGIVQQDKCILNKPITLMSIQSLLSRKYPDELYNQFGFIINDETQRFGSEKWSTVWRQFPAKYRLAVTADINRKDGLTNIIKWNLGEIGHTVQKKTAKLLVCGINTNIDYPYNSYKSWTPDAWGNYPPDPLKYDKKLAKDGKRNKIIVEELVKARQPGKRRILVFSRLRNHLDTLKLMFENEIAKIKDYPQTKVELMVGGQKKATRDTAVAGDVIFTTFSYARDALNITSLDTEFFATPPGDPLQPAGRLRDKGDANRERLLLVDFYENNEYSNKKWERREAFYRSKDHEIKKFTRN